MVESERKRKQGSSLHVLVVEHEPVVLGRTCARLLAAGCDLSTARVGVGLYDRVQLLAPDLVLMDVVLPGLHGRELSRLVAECKGGASPALVVHTKLLRPMLRRVLDVRAVFGLLPKTDDDAEFSRLFAELTDRLTSEMPTQVYVPRVGATAMSGTYAVTPTAAPAKAWPRALKYG